MTYDIQTKQMEHMKNLVSIDPIAVKDKNVMVKAMTTNDCKYKTFNTELK
jgi:hypothetical protein